MWRMACSLFPLPSPDCSLLFYGIFLVNFPFSMSSNLTVRKDNLAGLTDGDGFGPKYIFSYDFCCLIKDDMD